MTTNIRGTNVSLNYAPTMGIHIKEYTEKGVLIIMVAKGSPSNRQMANFIWNPRAYPNEAMMTRGGTKMFTTDLTGTPQVIRKRLGYLVATAIKQQQAKLKCKTMADLIAWFNPKKGDIQWVPIVIADETSIPVAKIGDASDVVDDLLREDAGEVADVEEPKPVEDDVPWVTTEENK